MATLSTFPLVPLTCEPTCTQAIEPGTSRSTLTPADTSRPSRSPLDPHPSGDCFVRLARVAPLPPPLLTPVPPSMLS